MIVRIQQSGHDAQQPAVESLEALSHDAKGVGFEFVDPFHLRVYSTEACRQPNLHKPKPNRNDDIAVYGLNNQESDFLFSSGILRSPYSSPPYLNSSPNPTQGSTMSLDNCSLTSVKLSVVCYRCNSKKIMTTGKQKGAGILFSAQRKTHK